MSRLKEVVADQETQTEEVSEKSTRKTSTESVFVKRLWDGDSDSLPQPPKDKKGNIIKGGEPRFLLKRGLGRYELQSIFRARGGVKTRIVRNLIDSNKRPNDRKLIASLKKAGAVIV